MGVRRGLWRLLVVKSEGMRLLCRHRHMWGDNIKMDLKLVVRVWTGLILLRAGTRNGLLI